MRTLCIAYHSSDEKNGDCPTGLFAAISPVLLVERSLPGNCERSAFLERRLFEDPMKVAQDRFHVGRPGGSGREVDSFAEERGVHRIKTSSKFDCLHGW